MKPSTHRSGKFRVFVSPRLGSPLPDEPIGAAADLWQAGEQAEAAYDFELAHLQYRAALRATAAAQQAAATARYAEFLVDRFGQFAEVAGWLDDPVFAAPDGRDRKSTRLNSSHT